MNELPRSRPAIFRALGAAEPPQEIRAAGRTWKLAEVFKHDSWAATALYGGTKDGVVVKFNRREKVFFLPMAWLGRWLAAREARAYEKLKGVPGIPPSCGPVDVGGTVWPNAFGHKYIEGHPLAMDERPGSQFFDELENLVCTMHVLGMAYLDLNKRENVLVTGGGSPCLVDFQIHFCPPPWLACRLPVRWALHQLQAGDLYHLHKLRTYHTLGPDAMAGIHVPWSSRLWRFLYVHPVQWLRRRLLVALRIRTGEGLAISEREPEKAVRLGRQSKVEAKDVATDKADPARYAGTMDVGSPEISIIVPARDEEENIRPLLEELAGVLSAADLAWEVIVVDDASSDDTLDRLRFAQTQFAGLKILSLREHSGKSAALAAGIAVARGRFIGMMDADLQNCPADFLTMMRLMREDPSLTLIQGNRIHRQDSWAKRQASRLGYLTRRLLLGDRIRDTGCAIKLLSRGCATRLPLHFEGLHRFIPFLVELNGGKVREIPVDHRPRSAGRSKYHVGFLSRGVCGFFDLLAVRWMVWRHRVTAAEAVSKAGNDA